MTTKKKVLGLFLVATAAAGLASCNSNDDAGAQSIEIPGVTIEGDVDCCSAEEALQVYKFLQTVRIIPELSTVVDDKYNVFAYSRTGSFHAGYNELYFVATKRSSGNYIKNFDVTALTPLMTMTSGGMTMQHSTPTSPSVSSFNDAYLAVRRGWVSFVMAGHWTLSYDVAVLGATASVADVAVTASALPDGQQWVQSFQYDGQTYYLSLVSPTDWQTGANTLQAYVSVRSTPATLPYALATDRLTIDIDPRMPDMGHHTSPGNTALTPQADGSYAGTVNLTMTGLWRIHLTVRDASGTVIAGGDDLADGYSSLYWDVTI